MHEVEMVGRGYHVLESLALGKSIHLDERGLKKGIFREHVKERKIKGIRRAWQRFLS